MENKNPRYLSLVIQKGRRDTQDNFKRDKRAVVTRITVGAIGAGVLAVINLLRTGAGGIMDILTALGIALIGAVISNFVWYLVTLVYYTVTSPARLYREQESEILKLRGQMEDLENPFEVTLLPANENYSQDDVRWASIRVYNKSSAAEIEDCFLKLTEILEIDKNVSRRFNPQKLSWSGREAKDRNQVLPVHCNDERWCDIAMTIPREVQDIATFTVWFGTGHQSMKIRTGKYRLTIEVHGVWQNRPIVHPYSVVLNFESKYKLMVESVEEIVKVSGQTMNPNLEVFRYNTSISSRLLTRFAPDRLRCLILALLFTVGFRLGRYVNSCVKRWDGSGLGLDGNAVELQTPDHRIE